LLRTPRPVTPPSDPGAGHRPWRPDPQAHYARSGADLLGQVRAWRDEHLPGVSGAAILFAAAWAAFEECGLRPEHPGTIILVDARRYLPKGATVDGNFATGPYIAPARPRDARAVQEALDRSLAIGQPLGVLAGLDLRSLLSRDPLSTTADTVRVEPRPHLALTHVGRLTTYAGLPWAAPATGRVMRSVPTVAGPESVTVSLGELAGVLHLNISYHRSTFEDKPVRRAAELICADPVALLTP
jgi:hypothetical protein